MNEQREPDVGVGASDTSAVSERVRFSRRSFGRFAGASLAAGGLAACSSTADPSDNASSGDAADTDTTSSTTASTTSSTAAAPPTLADVGLPERGDGPLRVIIDTDAANEIDDQFAIAWALLAQDRLTIEGITAAPFGYGNYLRSLAAAQARRGDGPRTPYEGIADALGADGIDGLIAEKSPADGMQLSLDEIDRFIAVAGQGSPPSHAGATEYMASTSEPVDSPAAQAIIAAAHASDDPLYVTVLGAPTNVASALLLDPTIADKIVVIFVAGYPSASREVDESFNLLQDLAASQVIFSESTHLVYIPGYQVSETLSLSYAESEKYLAGTGPLGDELHALMESRLNNDGGEDPGVRWVMWDMAPIAWLLDPDVMVLSSATTRGTITEDHTWEPTDGVMLESYRVDDKAVFIEFLGQFAGGSA